MTPLDAEIQDLVSRLADILSRKRLFLAVAESCTGGMLGEVLTQQAGASTFFKGGIIAYTNDSKAKLLAVPQRILAAHGAVSRPTVEWMARSACRVFESECAMSISGIAGPEGGSAAKPVGTVCIGACVINTSDSVRRVFAGDRATVRVRAVAAALRQLHKLLQSPAPTRPACAS
ncbi:MAG: nicotinamide-nucleotide amidohydrolase family protein [Chitinivibrionales bacterium]|nr:nicotinamide-nucleotide amidohydrolase family protein [Chitinivibrionales bacterium]